MQSHYITASRHCITPLRHNTRSTRSTAYTVGRRYKPISFHNRAMRHSRATLLPLNVPQQFCATPSGNTLPLFRRWRVRIEAVLNKPGDSFSTLGRRFKPTSFHNRAMRHSRATLQPQNVPQQFCATPSGNALPLFRRWRVRIDPVSNKPGDTFGTAHTLGRRYKPISFHNRAARHSRATLQPLNVPQQFCATPLGNTLPLFRRRNVRIDPVMNMLGDTFGTPWATIQAHIATPTEPHCTFGRHYYVPERVVGDGSAGCSCSHKKG